MATSRADFVVRTAMGLYQRSPLHPRMQKPLMRMMALAHRRNIETICDVTPQATGVAGFRMRLNRSEMIENRIYYTGTWEPETVKALRSTVTEGNTVLDIGAQVGFVTLTLARFVTDKGEVHALEASEWAYGRLKANIELNGFSWVTANRLAVGAESVPTRRLVLPCGYWLDGRDTGAPQEVPVTSVDDYVSHRGIDRVHAIKTDTDGMEPEVFRGARRTLERDRPTLLFEVHPLHLSRAGSSLPEIVKDLSGYGYVFHRETDLERSVDPLAIPDREWPGNLVAIAQ